MAETGMTISGLCSCDLHPEGLGIHQHVLRVIDTQLPQPVLTPLFHQVAHTTRTSTVLARVNEFREQLPIIGSHVPKYYVSPG